MALEFIKSLFKDNEALTYEDLEKAATERGCQKGKL